MQNVIDTDFVNLLIEDFWLAIDFLSIDHRLITECMKNFHSYLIAF